MTTQPPEEIAYTEGAQAEPQEEVVVPAASLGELEAAAAEAGKRLMPIWDAAIKAGNVTFDMLRACRVMSFDKNLVQRALAHKYYKLLLPIFLKDNGKKILDEWWSGDYCVVRTPTDFFVVNPGDVADLVYAFEELFYDAQRLLISEDRERYCRSAYEALTYVLGAAVRHDNAQKSAATADVKATNEARKDAGETSRRQLMAARVDLVKAAKRQATTWYLVGMVGGILGLFPLGLLAYWGLVFADLTGLSRGLFLMTLASGGVGAIISVLTRVTSEKSKLKIDHEAGRILLMLFGTFRPIIGGVFGALMYLLSIGGLLPIASSGAEANEAGFLAVVAFASGFSERFAQDMLTTRVKVDDDSEETPTPEKATPPTPPRAP